MDSEAKLEDIDVELLNGFWKKEWSLFIGILDYSQKKIY